MDHISQQVRDTLITDGWDDRDQTDGSTLFYRREETGGQFGETVKTLRLDRSGRWLEQIDGWGNVLREVDLRDCPNRPEDAIRGATA